MKKVILLTLIFVWHLMPAQEHKTELDWLTDFEKAKVIAKKEHKPILMLFTGSDWCPPCRAMHNELFPDPEFVKVSKKVVLLMVDFPRRKPMTMEQRQKNQALSAKFHRGGVPTFVAITVDEKVLGKMKGYSFGHPERDINFFKDMIQKNNKK